MSAISFSHVGKMYRLGRVGTGTLSHDLNRWWQMHVLRKEDPYLKIGETNERTQKGCSDYVWALNDISFQISTGEVVGIIGKNGAGKSTLLKLLSNITSPSTGTITYKGRIASLLEVGTGFHPELTGRENIYMNGAIMGMTKAEISAKLHEIVEFAGVGRYLDTPVKRYSSGMIVRLGFAVAAFLEPDILVVDEVLAVGDAEFQKKALGKMREVAQGRGRTVLFVSHNMTAIKSLCSRTLVLDRGRVVFDGPTSEAIDFYLNTSVQSNHKPISAGIEWHSPFLTITKILINGSPSSQCTLACDQHVLELVVEGTSTIELASVDVRFELRTSDRVPIAALAEGHYRNKTTRVQPGSFCLRRYIRFPKYLACGDYLVDIVLHQPNMCLYMQAPSCATLHVEGNADEFCEPLYLERDGFVGLQSDDSL